MRVSRTHTLLRVSCAPLRSAAEARRVARTAAGVVVSPIGDHFGTTTFAFSDPEDRWFAVIAKS
jgi:hypothetical protein